MENVEYLLSMNSVLESSKRDGDFTCCPNSIAIKYDSRA